MSDKIYDVAIIGAGPAGLTAAIYAKRAGLESVVIDTSMLVGGQIINTYEIENYPGFFGLSGMELAMKFKEHAEKFDLNLMTADVKEVIEGKVKKVVTSEGEVLAKTVIIATGADHRKIGLEGEAKLTGRGVSYCATCDGAFFRNKVAVVIGGGDVAVEDAIFLARGCSKVYLVHRRDELRAAKVLQNKLFALDNVEVIWDSIPLEITGENFVEKLKIKNVKTDEEKELETSAVFVAIGIVPRSDMFKDLVETDKGGYIVAGETCETSVKGIYACGDVRTTPLRQVITAAADGAVAITSAERYLSEY